MNQGPCQITAWPSRFLLSLSWTKVLAKAQPDPPGSYFLFHEPRSLPKHSPTLQLPTFLYPSPGMTPSSVAPRTVHSVRPGSTTTWPTCRDVSISYGTFLQRFQWFSRLSLPKPPSFLVTLQVLITKVTELLYTKFKSHMQRNCNTTRSSAVEIYFIHIHHSCKELHHLYLSHAWRQMYTQRYFILAMLRGTFPRYASRISQACLCNSASSDMRLSFNIAMISRWLRLISNIFQKRYKPLQKYDQSLYQPQDTCHPL